MSPQPLSPIRVAMTKWGARPHWEFDGVFLGRDEHGDWIGVRQGTRHSRPGLAFDSDVDTVTLAPTDGWFLATFHAPGIWCDLYVDMATPAEWDGATLRAVDLDLDVIRMADPAPDQLPSDLGARPPGTLFVDDEDEFAVHQARYGYPPEVIAAAEASRDQVFAAARAGSGPFDGSHRRWLAELS